MTAKNKPPAEGDVAVDDPAICKTFGGMSKMTLRRWREKHGFPVPAFFVSQRGFTWQSDIQRWIDSRPQTSALAGRSIPRASDHQAA